jgi:hypothetical protein
VVNLWQITDADQICNYLHKTQNLDFPNLFRFKFAILNHIKTQRSVEKLRKVTDYRYLIFKNIKLCISVENGLLVNKQFNLEEFKSAIIYDSFDCEVVIDRINFSFDFINDYFKRKNPNKSRIEGANNIPDFYEYLLAELEDLVVFHNLKLSDMNKLAFFCLILYLERV